MWPFTKKTPANHVAVSQKPNLTAEIADGSDYAIESKALDYEGQLRLKFLRSLEEQYGILCRERKTNIITAEMVATAYYRLITGPELELAKLRLEVQKLQTPNK